MTYYWSQPETEIRAHKSRESVPRKLGPKKRRLAIPKGPMGWKTGIFALKV